MLASKTEKQANDDEGGDVAPVTEAAEDAASFQVSTASDEVAKNKDMMRKQRSVFKKEKRTNSINHNFGFIQSILLVLFDQAVQVTLTIHLQFGLRPNG